MWQRSSGFGPDEVRSALGPRSELAQVTEAVREAADEMPPGDATPGNTAATHIDLRKL
ncbi:hypothetical protein ACIBW9_19185 [Streptomyces sp. NPDC049541]|uniref:hypothetical protein n=1 Tax=Streptomyces sp. NPDC049541 TaxID=3365594 RepID=UPI00378C841D